MVYKRESICIYKYSFDIFNSIYLKNAWNFLHPIPHQPARSISWSSVNRIVSCYHLDSLFHKAVNITSTPIGVESGGWWVALGFKLKKMFMSKWHQFKLFSALRTYQNVATSMLSLTSQLRGDSLLEVCLSRVDEAICRPPGLSQMSDRLNLDASVKVKADRSTFGYGIHMNY